MRAPLNCSALQTIGTRVEGLRLLALAEHFTLKCSLGNNRFLSCPCSSWYSYDGEARVQELCLVFLQQDGPARGLDSLGSPVSSIHKNSPIVLPLFGWCGTSHHPLRSQSQTSGSLTTPLQHAFQHRHANVSRYNGVGPNPMSWFFSAAGTAARQNEGIFF